jgi:DNA-binding Lrp family transcriptional regulator
MLSESDLDRIDFEILAALQNDARLSNKELAARVGLAPSSCLTRVRRLLRERVLRGFHARVEPAALGVGLQALVFVRLARHSRRQVEAFRRHALSLPQTVAVYHVSGRHDFLVHVAVRDADRLRDLTMDAFTTRREVGQIETHLIFEHVQRPELPSPARDDLSTGTRARRGRVTDVAGPSTGGRPRRARTRSGRS